MFAVSRQRGWLDALTTLRDDTRQDRRVSLHHVEKNLACKPACAAGRKIKRRLRQFFRMRARLETVLRILPVGVVIAEAPDGKALLGNEEATRIWEVRPKAQSIREYTQFEGYWPDGRRLGAEEWPLARAVAFGVTTTAEEINIVGADGTKRMVEHKAAPVRDANGSVVAGVVTLVVLAGHGHLRHVATWSPALAARLADATGLCLHDGPCVTDGVEETDRDYRDRKPEAHGEADRTPIPAASS